MLKQVHNYTQNNYWNLLICTKYFKPTKKMRNQIENLLFFSLFFFFLHKLFVFFVCLKKPQDCYFFPAFFQKIYGEKNRRKFGRDFRFDSSFFKNLEVKIFCADHWIPRHVLGLNMNFFGRYQTYQSGELFF